MIRDRNDAAVTVSPELVQWYAGLVAEAAAVLQDAGLWRYAATLAAGSLPVSAQAAVLDRWSAHIAQVCAALHNAFLRKETMGCLIRL